VCARDGQKPGMPKEEADIPGRADMSKQELVEALEAA
jgi:hypothetical protein